jgi:hypothetical protein
VFAAMDCFSATDMLSTVNGGQFGGHPDKWNAAVLEFLSLNLNCELISIVNYLGENKLNPEDAMRMLSSSDPTGNPEIWMVIQFTGTTKLKSLLEKFGLLNWESIHKQLNDIFISELFQVYNRNI